jgi:hypothetical protein
MSFYIHDDAKEQGITFSRQNGGQTSAQQKINVSVHLRRRIVQTGCQEKGLNEQAKAISSVH